MKRCVDSDQILDWIVQVGKKGWANDQVIADLIRKLDSLLALQDSACPGALRTTRTEGIDVGEMIRRVNRRAYVGF